jgi:outer membrane protein assembly factor BamE (lipoprotein component of BamABCDE complex)
MNTAYRRLPTAAALAAATLLMGCVTMPGSKSADKPAASGTTTAAAPASKIGPGMNERGEVVDPKKVEAGYGRTVKGLNDYEGEITGRPVPGSKFSQLQIGMPLKQVTDIVGTPSDQGAYVTGKAFIPFFFGSDRYRYEVVYKGQGRLVFAGSSGFDSNAHLIWIIHSANEQGYR